MRTEFRKEKFPQPRGKAHCRPNHSENEMNYTVPSEMSIFLPFFVSVFVGTGPCSC
jgi:hypothetical protein